MNCIRLVRDLEADATKELLESAGEDVKSATDDLGEGNVL